MPTVEDYIDEAKYNLGRTMADTESAMNLEEDNTEVGGELSERHWRLDEFLSLLRKARDLPLYVYPSSQTT